MASSAVVCCMADASAVHVYSLAARLNEQRRDGGAFCDIHLRVGDKTLPTHSCVLSACSPFFQELIRAHRPCSPHLSDVPQEIELELPGADDDRNDPSQEEGDVDAVTDLLEYMYTGKIELKEDSLPVVVQLAQAFALHELITLIGTYVNGPDKDGVLADIDSAPSALLASIERRRLRRRRRMRRQRNCKVDAAVATTTSSTGPATTAVSDTLDALRILRQEDTLTIGVVDEQGQQVDDVKAETVYHNMDLGGDEVEDGGEAFSGESSGADEQDDYYDEDELRSAQRSSLRPLVKRRRANRLSEEPYECRHCPFASSELKLIREHKLLHPGRSYKCAACDYHTGLASKLLSHMASAEHPQSECSLCGFALAETDAGGAGVVQGAEGAEALRLHLERHAMDTRNPFFCCICDFRCRTRGNLAMHVASKHSVERPFVCHHCGKGFKWSASLVIHLQTHQGKGFLCDQCGFRTAYKHHLKMHKRIHNGGMFVCEVDGCGFQSICKQKLERHLVTSHDDTSGATARRTPRAPRGSRAVAVAIAAVQQQQQQQAHAHTPELMAPNYVATYY